MVNGINYIERWKLCAHRNWSQLLYRSNGIESSQNVFKHSIQGVCFYRLVTQLQKCANTWLFIKFLVATKCPTLSWNMLRTGCGTEAVDANGTHYTTLVSWPILALVTALALHCILFNHTSVSRVCKCSVDVACEVARSVQFLACSLAVTSTRHKLYCIECSYIQCHDTDCMWQSYIACPSCSMGLSSYSCSIDICWSRGLA